MGKKKESSHPAPKKAHPAHAAHPVKGGADWRAGTAVRVRMYRHGLGDCFLLSFPRARTRDFRVLIDCGVILGTPNGAGVVKTVVDDLKAETAEGDTPTVDVLVATHEHWDHLSAFATARDEFETFHIDRVWMAWTEDPKNDEANRLRKQRNDRLHALRLGVAHLRNQLRMAGALGADAQTGAAADDYRRVAEVLTFFGVDPDAPAAPADGLGATGTAGRPGIADAMDWCRDHKGAAFWNPGDLIDLGEDVKGLRVYVLGPPTDQKQLFKDLPTRSGNETYGLAFFGAAVDPAQVGRARTEFEQSAPFDPKYRVDVETAAATEFFRAHYFGTGPDDPDGWRRIDGEGLAGAAAFALNLDSNTNNTSLALAFELADGRVLLFPGDAQVGNWESWHADSAGQPRVWKADQKEVTAKDLLARTVVYKVGHHGSHNATLREKGLEMMARPDLVALVPVDTYIAHEKKHWGQMPFDPLIARLKEKTGGRVVLADETAAAVKLESGFPGRLEDAEALIDVTGSGGNAVQRPLYVDFFVPASRG